MDPFADPKETSRSSHALTDADVVRRFAKISLIYHLALVPLVLFAGHWLLRVADSLGGLFGMATLALNKNDFWMAPIVGVLVTLAVSSFRVYANPRRLEWLQPLLLIHGITAASFLAFYFADVRSMTYLAGTLLEAVCFGATLYIVLVYRHLGQNEAPSGSSETILPPR